MKSGPRPLAIGDTEPVPIDSNMEMAKRVQADRGKLVRAAKSNSQRGHARAARIIMRWHDEAAFRRTDPIEQAKTFLRRKGYSPVYQSGDSHFIVGSRSLNSAAEVIALAQSKGWTQ